LKAKRRAARKLFVLPDARGLKAILEAAGDLPLEERPRNELDDLTSGVAHQGVVLEVEPLPVLDAKAWANGPFPEDAIIVVLDGVEDPHNFGAVVRSAAACGAAAVLFGKDRAAPITAASLKSAAGAMEHINLVQTTNLVRTLDALKNIGFWVTALEAEAPQLLWEADLTGRVALVIGSEGKGIRRLVSEHADYHLRIPLKGPITSLNASVSAAIALAECLRQRAVASSQ
jgi:23S rRNA (guanosine2251-2'-O)-methyltransferase